MNQIQQIAPTLTISATQQTESIWLKKRKLKKWKQFIAISNLRLALLVSHLFPNNISVWIIR